MKSILNNKRGQFYIIAAAIMIAIIASLSARMNYGISVPQAVKFYDLSDNFEKEGYKIIDTYILHVEGDQASIQAQIDDFTTNFLKYAHEKDPNLGLVYIYSQGGVVYVRNELPGNVGVTGGVQAPGTTTTLTGTDLYSISRISVQIGEKETVRDVQQRETAFGAIKQTAFSSPWVILNIGGSLFSFNTNDNQNFYVIVTTTGGQNETWVNSGESTEITCASGLSCINLASNVNLRCSPISNTIGCPSSESCCTTSGIMDCLTLANRATSSCANGNVCAKKGDGSGCCEGKSCQVCYCATQESGALCDDNFDNNGNGDVDGRNDVDAC